MFVNITKNIAWHLLLLVNLSIQCFQQPDSSILHDNQCYNVIRLFLNQYQRSFTLLDIDTAEGLYALRAAQDYNAVCVMTGESDALLEICKTNSKLTNIILLKKHFTPAALQHLGECEHFDVVLSLNLLNEYGEQWQDALGKMLSLGDYVIVKVTSNDKNLEKYVVEQGGQSIGTVSIGIDDGVTLYNITSSNKYLRRKTWLRSIMHKEHLYRIESSFTKKQLVKPVSWPHGTLKTTPWLPGINLCTFKMCNGVYPTNEMLKQNLHSLKNIEHTDWLINNMIIQGDKLSLIDFDDESCKMFFSKEGLNAHEEIFDLNDPAKIEHYFWYKLIKTPITRKSITKFFSQLFNPNSLVFDLASCDKKLIDHYLTYGVKVISFEPNINVKQTIYKKFNRENIFISTKESLMQKTGKALFIDSMLEVYGMPQFCKIHADARVAFEYLKSHTKPITCICFKFDIQCKNGLVECLNYLSFLGYKKFNFSVRDLPGFILESNKYNGLVKDWAQSIDELMIEIDKCYNLDYNPNGLYGYIYAKSV